MQSVRGMGREKEEWLHEIQGGELAFTYLLSLSLLLPLPQGWGLQRLVLPALRTFLLGDWCHTTLCWYDNFFLIRLYNI